MAAQRVRQRTMSTGLATCVSVLAAEHAAWARSRPGFADALRGVRPDRFGLAAAVIPPYGLLDDNAGVVDHSPTPYVGATVYYWLLRLPLRPAATPRPLAEPPVVSHSAAFAANPVGAAPWRALPASALNRPAATVRHADGWHPGVVPVASGSVPAAVSCPNGPRATSSAVAPDGLRSRTTARLPTRPAAKTSAPTRRGVPLVEARQPAVMGISQPAVANTLRAVTAETDAGWYLSVFTTGDWRYGQVLTGMDTARGSGLHLDFPGPDWAPEVTVAALRNHLAWEFAQCRRRFDTLTG